MFLRLKYKYFRRIDRGWDPVSVQYADAYYKRNEDPLASAAPLVAKLQTIAGALAGKRILDLGAGPGHYSVALARAGADVVWHDPSRNYLRIAKALAEQHGVDVKFSLGYLEDAVAFTQNPFDVVLNRVCWYYSCDDRRFSRILYQITKPGGLIHVIANTDAFYKNHTPRLRVALWLNKTIGLKIDHVHPPRRRIASLFHAYEIERMVADYTCPIWDEISVVKKQ